MAWISCTCGEVRGEVRPAEPRLANRVTCYCDDCQAFAHYLKRTDLLDERGGSDIVQIPPATLIFTQGQDKIAGVRLTAKGLHRWRASCCGSPLGNTMTPAIPFVGLLASSFRVEGQDPDALFGKPRGAIMGQYAIGGAPPGTKGIRPWLMATTIVQVLGWRFGGRVWPHPFFDRATGATIYPVSTLSRDERERLRALTDAARAADPKPLA
jgi:hypothetical protein